MKVTAQRLSAEAFRPFGDVLAIPEAGGRPANDGTARRFDHAADLRNLRPGAKPNLTLFSVEPITEPPVLSKFERHPYSSQAFIPLGSARYLVAVAPNDPSGAPDLSQLAAFLVEGATGINYHAGLWHHPMAVLDTPAQFAVLVWEDGTAGDTELVPLAEPISVVVP